MRNRFLLLLLGLMAALPLLAQDLPLRYEFGEKYDDRYRYSNLLSISGDGSGGYVLVRAYYKGLILNPKGYVVERYDKDLNLLSEYQYKIKQLQLVEAFVSNGQVNLLFLRYDETALAYEYTVHRSPMDHAQFTVQPLLRISAEAVAEPLDRNLYNRDFGKGFSTTVLFDQDKRHFVISTHYRKNRKEHRQRLHVFNSSLAKVIEQDFSTESEDKNYAFEEMVMAPDRGTVYLLGKAYYRKKRISALERRFQYEVIKLSPAGYQVQPLDHEDFYSEGLKPVFRGNDLLCVGFYSDRKRGQRYNGIAYMQLDPGNLEVEARKYEPFTSQFMFDKFGKEDVPTVKNLVFKGLNLTPDGSLLFNAEEYFVTSSVQANSSGGRLRVERYHHNDIVSVKMGPGGDLQWARNINKSEVTQGDGAYASYSAFTRGGNTYFFISTAADNPQLLNKERLMFRQGLSRNRNLFAIALNEVGDLSYEKVIDAEEARLPLMVSFPYEDPQTDEMVFYAKRGTKKQLVRVRLASSNGAGK